MNAQDIDIYVFMDDGIYLYDAPKHVLNQVVAGDYRVLPGKTDAPVNLVLITDISKFRAGNDSLKIGWGNIDAGIVSQNISLFCSATGLKTRPRASFPGAEKIRELLKLKGSQYILLNHPVGYKKK
jgi:nitroreductase